MLRSSELTFAGWKIVKKCKQHFDHTYKEGLNIDKKKFNPSGEYTEGGLYFASKNVLDFLYLYNFNDVGTIHRVYTYPDSKVYHEYNKSKTDKFWLEKGFDLSLESTWKMMFENGIDIHADNEYALKWASKNGQLSVVNFLVEKGAHVNNVPFLCNGHLSVVKFFFEKGADIHAYDDYALRWAAESGHLSVVKFLIEKGANIHARDDIALFWAACNGQLPVVKFLVEKGANIHASEDCSLRRAAEAGYLSVVEFLVEKGANIHASDDYALRWAANNDHLSVVEFLVEKGANIHAYDDYALRWAANNDNLSVVEFLKSQ